MNSYPRLILFGFRNKEQSFVETGSWPKCDLFLAMSCRLMNLNGSRTGQFSFARSFLHSNYIGWIKCDKCKLAQRQFVVARTLTFFLDFHLTIL